ncbi:ribosomal oxygenase 2 isoform X1 [Pleurodeles waltl]|uniref:ribosomal oxygenase 2 isoform X1 n=1 Tax=Pleurodeles waltl TaxID=8319 RepID=UPI00370956C0
MSAGKKPSGAAFRKKRKLKELERKALTESLSRQLTPANIKQEPLDSNPESSMDIISVCVGCDEEPSTSMIKHEETNIEEDVKLPDSCSSPPQTPENVTNVVDLSDPADWPDVITTSLRDIIVRKGPVRPEENFKYPKDESDRRFTAVHYIRRLPNGEDAIRNWIVYSKKKNRIFCFCCKLFTTIVNSYTSDGYSDWRHLTEHLSQHEQWKCHLAAMQSWVELLKTLESKPAIDITDWRLYKTETQHWQSVLQRFVAIIQYLGQQCLPLDGRSDTLYSDHNGHFLKLVEMFATFDNVMLDHLKKMNSLETQQHYVGRDIQNELLSLISKELVKCILQSLKKSKYYSIILDCSPDIGDALQMTMIIRFVSIKQKEMSIVEPEVSIQERFLGFITQVSPTGAGLTQTILAELERLSIPLKDMRGQAYDHISNIKARQSRVQQNILNLNSRAFNIPCSNHSLNLVVNEAAMLCKDVGSFLIVLQRICLFLSGVTRRCDVLTKQINKLSMKTVCQTTWSSIIDIVRTFRFQAGEIYSTLLEISEDSTFELLTRGDAANLADELSNFKFLCSIVIWFSMLQQINSVSILQVQAPCLPDLIEGLLKTKLFLEEYRSDKGFENALQESRELASEMDIFPTFPKTIPIRSKKRKMLPSCEDLSEYTTDPKNQFKIHFFDTALDIAIKAVNERLNQLQHHNKFFGFLYDIRKVRCLSSKDLLKYCMDLQEVLTDKRSKESDIDGIQLCKELTVLAPVVKQNMTLTDILAHALVNGGFPNLAIALRILLTLPVLVAVREKNVSKLDLIKNYLRSPMSQEQHLDLAMISIENQITEEIDYGPMLCDYGNEKARKCMCL